MIDRMHPLSLTKQAKAAGLSRGSMCYLPRPVSETEVAPTPINALQLERPVFVGARMLRDLLTQDGVTLGRKYVGSLMRRMGIEAMYRKSGTSRRNAKHPIHPYRVRHLTIDRPNQVSTMDITYIR